MSDTEQHDNVYNDVRIHSKINIYAPVLLSMALPFTGLALVIFGVWMFTHWTAFVGMTPVIVYISLSLVGVTVLGLVAALWVKIVLHPMANAHQKISEAHGQAVRNKLIVAHDNYVVVARKNGELELLTASQEKHVYNYRVAGTSVTEVGSGVPALPAPVPAFSQLLAQGIIQQSLQRGQMLIGFVFDSLSNEWVARFGSWLDLYSCAIAGVLGSGKTTTALFLLLQALLAGAKMILVDPHLHDPAESLAERLSMFRASMVFAPCDDTPADILERVRWVANEFKRRKALGVKAPALIVVFEEFNACMRKDEVAKEIADLLTIIEQEARKFGIFAILIGQYWSQQGIGSAVVRQCLASALVHRMGDIEQAKKLLGLPKQAQTALQLKRGHHVFKDTSGGYAETVTPQIVDSDLVYVASLLTETSGETSPKPVRNQPETSMEDLAENPLRNQRETSIRNQSEQALQARARDIIKMQANGKAKPEIMRLLWGVSPGNNDAYRQANDEFTDAMQLVQTMIGDE